MSVIILILSLSLLLSVCEAFANNDYIRHGDTVSISFWIVNVNTSIVNVVKTQPYIFQRSEFSTFTVFKKPYYKSDKNILITGKGVEFVWSNKTCGVLNGGTLSCIGQLGVYANETLRILQKHGGDGQYMRNGNYIKFRSNKKSVDCFANGKTVNCWKNKHTNDLYGFVIVKNVWTQCKWSW